MTARKAFLQITCLFLLSGPGFPKDTRESSPLPLLALGGSVLLMEIGEMTSHAGFVVRQNADGFWDRYLSSGGHNEELLSAYRSRYYGYLSLELTSYALWAAASSAFSLGAFTLPEQAFRLSPEGRYFFTVGMGLSFLGRIIGFSSGLQAIENESLWESYIAGGGASVPLGEAYEHGYEKYVSGRMSGAAFRLLGAAAIVGSFIIPGDDSPVAQKNFQKLLIGAGSGMAAAGNVFRSAALTAKQRSEEEWDRYLSAGSPPDSPLLEDYEKQYRRYLTSALLAYGLWIGGGASVLGSVYLPFAGSASGGRGRTAEAEQPVELELYPLTSGIGLAIRY